MAIDPKLQALLEKSAPDESVDVVLVVKSEHIILKPGAGNQAGIKERRTEFAKHAGEFVRQIVDEVADTSGKKYDNLIIYDHLASARITASVEMVRQLAVHPMVATIILAQ